MQEKKINMLFAGLGSVSMVKNCDLGLENAAFSSLRSQFFTILTDPKPANNIYESIFVVVVTFFILCTCQLCRLERVSAGPGYHQELFVECPPIFVSENCSPPSDSLMSLINLCGGKVK